MVAKWQLFNQKLWLSIPVITAGAFIYFGSTVLAQVTPDQTLGKESSVVTPISPKVDRIDGGAVRGSNLFHSFKDFNVGEGRRVNFANPAGIDNILSRVTGGNASNILGTLGVLGNANLYLLNPNGIIFGPNARLDIRGSFVASTGKGITFEDRILYGANNSGSKPLLTMAVPVGLQYGTQGGNISNAGNLKVGQGQKLALAGSTVTTSGKLTAPGGTVHVLGERVGLLDNAQIDVSGETAGGNVLIGGDFQGKGEVPNAKRTFVGSNVSINADARTSGDGGRVIVWADETTGFYGNISARGGSQFGDGGFAEVSGKGFLDFASTVDLSAVNGQFGSLLLDPENIKIVEGSNNPSELSDSGVSNTIRNGTINAATANVILQASEDITFDAPVNIAANGVGLTAEANNNINVNADITSNRGNITLQADKDDSGAGALIINNAVINTNGGNFVGSGKGSDAFTSGVNLLNSTITAVGGNIELTGIGRDGGTHGKGINVERESLIETTGIGTITLIGTSGIGNCSGISCENHGTLINNSKVISENGKINLIGNGASSTGHENHGIYIIRGSLVESTGIGSIDITGTTEAKIGNSISEDPVGNDGISITGPNSQIISNMGNITITGTGGEGGEEEYGNQGIALLGLNTKVSSVSGKISLTGTARGIGNNHFGIFMGERSHKGTSENQGSVTSENGNITLIGKGSGTGTNNIGIFIDEGGLVETTGKGKIFINGTAGNGTDENHGILIRDNSKVSSVDGEIDLFGRGGSNTTTGSNNNGISIFKSSVVETTGIGKIFLNGTAGNEDGNNAGIKIQDSGSKVSSSGGGDINLDANFISLIDRGQVTASTKNITDNEKKGGNISVNASDTLELLNGGRLRAQTFDTANGGNITIETNKLDIKKTNQFDPRKVTGIGTDTQENSSGDGGNLTINAAESITISGNDDTPFNPSVENVIPLISDHCTVDSICTGLTTSTLGRGKAGNLTINTKRLIMKDKAGATTASLSKKENAEDGGVLTVNVTEFLEFQNLAGLATTTRGFGNAGSLIIDAGQITLQHGALFSADTFGSGKGGELIIKTNELKILHGSRVGAATAIAGGEGGNIKINTPENKAQLVQIDGISANGKVNSGIFSDSKASGDAGNLEIYTNNLKIQNSGEVSVSSSNSGFSGNTTVNADQLTLQEKASITADTSGSGKGGDLTVNTNKLSIISGSRVSASTSSQGKGGSIKINTPDNKAQLVQIDGISANGKVNSGIFSDSKASGDAGNLEIYTENLKIQNSGEVSVSSSNSGFSGNTKINADQVTLLEEASITADTSGSGKGGDLTIHTNELNISSGSRVSASTSNIGKGGSIKINTPNNKAQLVKIDGISANGKVNSGIFSDSKASGDAGNLEIYTDNLKIQNSGEVSVSSSDSGLSGNMTVNVSSILLKNQASIKASTSTKGEGGDITITAANDIKFEGRDSEISSEALEDANGGNLNIESGGVIISLEGINANNDIVVTADGRGVGGKLDAKAKYGAYGFVNFNKFRTPDSDFSAASRLGEDGTLSLITNNPQPQLPQQTSVREIIQVCPASQGVTTRAAGKSEYINTGHGGLPPNPNEALESNTAQVPWVTLNSEENQTASAASSTPQNTSTPKVIREAQGWVKMPNGKLLLTTQNSNSSSLSCVFQTRQP